MSEPTLVAMITSSCFLRRAIQRPITVSDSPPSCPFTQREYESAVSTRLNPAPKKASSSLNDIASSAVQPNTLPPRASGATSNPVLPSLRFGIASSVLARSIRSVRRHQACDPEACRSSDDGEHSDCPGQPLPVPETREPVVDIGKQYAELPAHQLEVVLIHSAAGDLGGDLEIPVLRSEDVDERRGH